MQSVRARVASGRLKLANWDSVRSGRDRPDPNGYFISLVPTQLEHLMADRQALSWLKGFRAVLLGGGPTMPSLLERARSEGVPLAPAYGMTETAALVTVLRPTEFLAGRTGVGKPLPQVEIVVVGNDGRPVPAGRTGRIQVVSESLFHGYETEKGSALDLCGGPQRSRADPFLTGDLGYMDSEGFLTVVGRADDVIISGGEKVSPGEVEAAIRDAGLAREVVVFGLADERWGEVVCAVVSGGDFNDETSARARLKSGLPVYKIPRRWRKVERLPRNRMGKLDRSRLAEMMEAT
jgi:O-succinylbenzoic acid--CoA ligase